MEQKQQNRKQRGTAGFKPLPVVLAFGITLVTIFSGGAAIRGCAMDPDPIVSESQASLDAVTKDQMEKELLQISDSLTTMDGSVTENLTALSKFNESTIERVEGLEKTVGEVREIIEEYLKTEETERSEVTESLTTISTELSTVQESLVSTKEKLVTLIEEMKTADRERETQIQKEFEKVAEMLDRSKNQLSQTYESLVSMIDVLRSENTSSTKEVGT